MNNKDKYINIAAEKAEEYLKSLYIYDDSFSIKDFFFNIGTWYNHLSVEQKENINLIAVLGIIGPYDVNIDLQDEKSITRIFDDEKEEKRIFNVYL